MKIEANEVCGCPLIDEQQEETDQLCRLARKKCTRHVAWRRLRRGEIDLKRVHQVWNLYINSYFGYETKQLRHWVCRCKA